MRKSNKKKSDVFKNSESLAQFFREAGQSEGYQQRIKKLIEGPHPSTEILYDYSVGNLTTEQVAYWSKHITHCPKCWSHSLLVRQTESELRGVDISEPARIPSWREGLTDLVSRGRLEIAPLVARITQVMTNMTVPCFSEFRTLDWNPGEQYPYTSGEWVVSDQCLTDDPIGVRAYTLREGYVAAFAFCAGQLGRLIYPTSRHDKTFVTGGGAKDIYFEAPEIPGLWTIKMFWSRDNLFNLEELATKEVDDERAIDSFFRGIFESDPEDWMTGDVLINVVQESIPRAVRPKLPPDCNVYAIRAVRPQDDKDCNYWSPLLFTELLAGRARYGWSDSDDCELGLLGHKHSTGTLNKHDKDCWKHSKFLKQVKRGDILIYVNIPNNHSCVLVEVTGSYHFSDVWDPGRKNDRRHFFHCKFIKCFYRNPPAVSPKLSSSLKKMGSHWSLNKVKKYVEKLIL